MRLESHKLEPEIIQITERGNQIVSYGKISFYLDYKRRSMLHQITTALMYEYRGPRCLRVTTISVRWMTLSVI